DNLKTFSQTKDVTLINSLNTDDVLGSSDAACMDILGNTVCMWAHEERTAQFAVIVEVGSITVVDLVPLDFDGFSTVGTDPGRNRAFAASEPSAALVLFGAVAALAAWRSQRRRRRQ